MLPLIEDAESCPVTPDLLLSTNETPLLATGVFHDVHKFQKVYQRNNKKGGLKNLRCFPSCSHVHRLKGFCGRPVMVSFPLVLKPCSLYHTFMEFVEEDQPASFPSTLHVDDARKLVRTKTEATLPWIEGKWKEHTTFEFNAELRGWHYSWESNKHKCDTKHHLVCALYEEKSRGELVLCATCASPSFVLFCRRRKRFVLEPIHGALREVKRERIKDDEDSFMGDEGVAADALLFLQRGGV